MAEMSQKNLFRVSLSVNVLLALLVFLLCHQRPVNSTSSTTTRTTVDFVSHKDSKEVSKTHLFIGIGSAFNYFERRQEIRSTWLQWANEFTRYKFYTDLPADCSQEYLDLIRNEIKTFKDLIVMPTKSGRSGFGYRGVYMLKHASQKFEFNYLMRIDDDGFACLPAVEHELFQYAPRERYLWGKYWQRKGSVQHSWIGRNRMDESFMVMSADVVKFIVENSENSMLAFDGEITFALNVAFWTHFLNLTIFDDRDRIDSQQRYLTTYMHQPFVKLMEINGTYSAFCRDFIFAHHVYPGIMKYATTNVKHSIPAPVIKPPSTRGYLYETKHFSSNLPQCSCASLARPHLE